MRHSKVQLSLLNATFLVETLQGIGEVVGWAFDQRTFNCLGFGLKVRPAACLHSKNNNQCMERRICRYVLKAKVVRVS